MSVWAICAAGALGACHADEGDQAALQALLRDEPLQQVPPGAATAQDEVAHAEPAALATAPPIGTWRFDDCTPSQTELRNSISSRNTAFRAVNVACVGGVQGQGVAIAATEDIVYVPDQPNFTFEGGVTVAGWFKPDSTSGTRTLIRKRDQGTSSFALLLNGGKFQFVASFGEGRAASVTAPTKAKTGVFQHVAATYDGQTLRLYVGGAEVVNFPVPGTIPNGAGPLLMGNDGSERRFNGTLDSMAFATHALTADEVQQLTCLSELPTLVVSPTEIPPTPAGVPVSIDIALTNHNPPSCAPLVFSLSVLETGLQTDPPPGPSTELPPVRSGDTAHVSLTAATAASADPGSQFTLFFQVFEPTTSFRVFEVLSIPVAAPTGCHVDVRHELMITSLPVVEDAVRTRFDAAPGDPRRGVWTVKQLLEDMAPTPADAPAMVEAVLGSFGQPQVINGFTVDVRPGMQREILARWPRTPDGHLDLTAAPFRLQAIVNRFDLRNLANGDAGEGRFVFAFVGLDGFPFQATMIFEYKLPAASPADVLGWAQAFHALAELPDGESYNAALQAITDRFARRGARSDHTNGSAINSVRTNEIDFSANGIWELRQFNLSPTRGVLEPVPLDLTPDRSFDNSEALASYINANQAQIIAETHSVPAVFGGQAFQAGAVFNDLTTWRAPGVDPEARHHFALNTCNGCHSFDETGVGFLQINPRIPGQEASLSGFLTGANVVDVVSGKARFFDDLGRRRRDLEAIVCPSSARAGTSLTKGIQRVH